MISLCHTQDRRPPVGPNVLSRITVQADIIVIRCKSFFLIHPFCKSGKDTKKYKEWFQIAVIFAFFLDMFCCLKYKLNTGLSNKRGILNNRCLAF